MKTFPAFENGARIAAVENEDPQADNVAEVLQPDSIEAESRNQFAAEAVQKVLLLVRDSRRPALVADCILWASGGSTLLQGKNESDIARTYGVTRAYVSKTVGQLMRQLRLPLVAGAKNEERKAACQEGQDEHYARDWQGSRNFLDRQRAKKKFCMTCRFWAEPDDKSAQGYCSVLKTDRVYNAPLCSEYKPYKH